MILSARGLSVERGGRGLIRTLDLDVEAGSIHVVLGPNGAGKSSLLLALSGVIDSGGECILMDKPLHSFSRSELAAQIAWQGELPPTEFGLTVGERLDLAAGTGGSDLQPAVAAMELGGLLKRSLGELSSGERQRVEIAAVMVRDCPLWLFDEPTAHLDLKHQMAVLGMFRDEVAEGRTIVTVLHDLPQAVSVASHAVLLDGRSGAEAGAAAGLLTAGRLGSLFQVKLQSFSDGGENLLLPDYRT